MIVRAKVNWIILCEIVLHINECFEISYIYQVQVWYLYVWVSWTNLCTTIILNMHRRAIFCQLLYYHPDLHFYQLLVLFVHIDRRHFCHIFCERSRDALLRKKPKRYCSVSDEMLIMLLVFVDIANGPLPYILWIQEIYRMNCFFYWYYTVIVLFLVPTYFVIAHIPHHRRDLRISTEIFCALFRIFQRNHSAYKCTTEPYAQRPFIKPVHADQKNPTLDLGGELPKPECFNGNRERIIHQR